MKHAFLFIFPLALLAGTAFAGDPKESGDHASNQHSNEASRVDEFSRLDLDHDGVLSRAEMSHHPKAAHMAMVDEDHDGTLSREEFSELEGM